MANTAKPTTAVYTGVFDPFQIDHFDVISRACKIFDRLVIGVTIGPKRALVSSIKKRVELIEQASSALSNVEVLPFSGLAVRFVREVGAYIMLRSVRTAGDMEYESLMSLTNLALAPEIETVFLMAKEA